MSTPKWVESGSVIQQTAQYRLRTTAPQGAGIELVLTQNAQGSWVLTCESLWANGQAVIVAPSSTPAEDAKLLALSAANSRMMDLGRALLHIASRALGRPGA